jgi:H+/Cl- antiporter ClcA
MFSHFINLLARSWDGLMTATSSSTFGFWLWTIFGGFFTGAMGTFLFKLYTAVKESQEKELLTWLRESVLVGGFASSCAIALAVMAWIAFIIPTVYRDHHSLVQANQELRGLMKELRTSESDHRHFMNVLSGFTGYRMRITGAGATKNA